MCIIDGVRLNSVNGEMLVRSMGFSGVTGFIAVDPSADDSIRTRYLDELLAGMVDASPLQAHNAALNSIDASSIPAVFFTPSIL